MKHDLNFIAGDALELEAATTARWGSIGDISKFVDDVLREVDAKYGPLPDTGIRHCQPRKSMKR